MSWRLGKVVVFFCFVAGAARADLPPPEGKKQVGYAFEVRGLAAFGDWVLLARPLPVSEGGVTRGFAKLEDGKQMRVDRRNGTPKLYGMKKAAYEKWLAKYVPASEPREDSVVEALFKSNQVVACTRNPEPIDVLDDSDPRSKVIEVFRARKLDGESCQLDVEAAGAPAPLPTASATPVAPASSATPVAPASSATSPAPEPTSTAQRSGCGGCTASSHGGSGQSALVLLGALALFRRRRASRQ